jgi:hypothetical protein
LTIWEDINCRNAALQDSKFCLGERKEEETDEGRRINSKVYVQRPSPAKMGK